MVDFSYCSQSHPLTKQKWCPCRTKKNAVGGKWKEAEETKWQRTKVAFAHSWLLIIKLLLVSAADVVLILLAAAASTEGGIKESKLAGVNECQHFLDLSTSNPDYRQR